MKKVYAIITKDGKEYCAHIDEPKARMLATGWNGSSVKYCTKAEYRDARDGGMPRYE